MPDINKLWSKIEHRDILAMFNAKWQGGANRPRSVSWFTVYNKFVEYYKKNNGKLELAVNESESDNEEPSPKPSPKPARKPQQQSEKRLYS